ncbi:MAG: hypothetical protein Kow0010_14910 [Dehalococcoidia bacterium]
MLVAGAAAVDITPPVGTPLDGYGGRIDVSRGVHDPLSARALYLDDGEAPVALVVCDLVGVGRSLVARARELIAGRPGIPAERVLVAATHTHAGPAGVRGTGDPSLVEMVARQVAGAVQSAKWRATEGRLKYGIAPLDSIAQNRREPSWPIDHRLDVLAVDTPDGTNLATVARYSCHPTTMERDNLLISADYPGAARTVIEQVIGGGTTALYFNGCCGNINPAWIRQEFGDMWRVGSIAGARAAVVSQELRPLGVNHQAHNIRWNELTEKPVTAGRLVEEAPLKAASRTVEMPYRTGLEDEQLATIIASFEQELGQATTTEERRSISARLTRARGERAALQRVRSRGPARPCEVQAMRLGEGLYLLGLPGEVFVETQEEIREASGMEDLIIAAYANDYPGYFCRPEAYEQGGYEAGVTPFSGEADRLLVRAALDVLEEVR